MNFLCKIGLHDWRVVDGGKLKLEGHSPVDRVCLRCGKCEDNYSQHMKRWVERLKIEAKKQALAKRMYDDGCKKLKEPGDEHNQD